MATIEVAPAIWAAMTDEQQQRAHNAAQGIGHVEVDSSPSGFMAAQVAGVPEKTRHQSFFVDEIEKMVLFLEDVAAGRIKPRPKEDGGPPRPR